MNENEACTVLSGLLIRAPWINLILEGSKTWEIRGTHTGKRGRIALIQSGTGTVIGVAELVDALGPLTLSDLVANASKAGFDKHDRVLNLPYQRTFAWVLQRTHRLRQPVPYAHPHGAVIWVSLAHSVERDVLEQIGRPTRDEG